jgi:hypothetical protein
MRLLSFLRNPTPDASIFPSAPSRLWPTICLEVGYSESYRDLLDNASLLLDGSESSGRIGRVNLIKFEPLEPTLLPNALEIREGFLEV